MNKKYKHFSVLFAVCLVLSVLVTFAAKVILPFEENGIYSQVVRLHVVANSSQSQDQAVKLLVRDEILKRAEHIFEGKNIEEAKETAALSCEEITKITNKVLADNGFPYKAETVFGIEDYPTREYDGITFPAGKYYSLRVLLGEHEGKNWWCVLFPPLCLGSASVIERIGGNTAKTWKNNSLPFKFRLKILDWLW